jgi:hypothetical protein
MYVNKYVYMLYNSIMKMWKSYTWGSKHVVEHNVINYSCVGGGICIISYSHANNKNKKSRILLQIHNYALWAKLKISSSSRDQYRVLKNMKY